MPRFLYIIAMTFAFCAAHAQKGENPNIAYIYPAGGQIGKTFKIIVAGKDLAQAKTLSISGGGISCQLGTYIVPADKNDTNSMMRRFEKQYLLEHPEVKDEIAKREEEGKNGDAYLRKLIMAIPENVEAIAQTDASYYLRRISGDPMAETLEVEITIDENAMAGERSLCLITENGISNSIPFMVGIYPEQSKRSLREVAQERARLKENWGKIGRRIDNPNRMIIPSQKIVSKIESMPCVLNGQITEANVDTYEFFARTGSNIVFSVQAQALVRYISDAVPGWFQPVVSIRDSDGKEVAYVDDFNQLPDPSGFFRVPKDGLYTIEIRDSIYRSREDFVYRLTIGEIPFVTGVFPPVVRVGEASKLKLYGWNLGDTKEMEFKTDNEGIFDISMWNSGFCHNRMPILAIPSECKMSVLSEPNASVDASVASVYAGCFSVKNQEDKFNFKAKKGEKFGIETYARRLNAPTDTYLCIRDAKGKIVAVNDDFENADDGYTTHHADSRLEFAAPADGVYTLCLKDAQSQFSPIHSYVLTFGRMKPDFSLRTTTSNFEVNARRTGRIEVKAFRKNGFDGEINLEFKNLPEGFVARGTRIPKNTDTTYVYVSAPDNAEVGFHSLELTGTAKLSDGGELSRAVLPCDNMMQAFYYWHLAPAKEMIMAVTAHDGAFGGKYKHTKVIPLKDNYVAKIFTNAETYLKVGTARPRSTYGLIPEAVGLPDGIKVRGVSEWKGGLYISFEPDPNSEKKAVPGTKGEISEIFVARRGNNTVKIDAVPPFKYELVERKKAPDAKKGAIKDASKSKPQKKPDKKADKSENIKKA